MVILQFGMTKALLKYRWSNKRDKGSLLYFYLECFIKFLFHSFESLHMIGQLRGEEYFEDEVGEITRKQFANITFQ